MVERKETDKEKEELKKKEEGRNIAIKNINSSLWNYALPKLVTFENYGKLSESAQRSYLSTVSKTPSQEIYEQLFFPQLASENGAVTSPYIQNNSALILQQSFTMLKVDDIANYVGLKNIKSDYKGKYVADLDKKDAATFTSGAFQYLLNKKIVDMINGDSKEISSGLEKLLCEEKKEE